MKLVDTDLDFWAYMSLATVVIVFVAAAFVSFLVFAELMSGPALLLLTALVVVFVALLIVRKGLAKREPRMRR